MNRSSLLLVGLAFLPRLIGQTLDGLPLVKSNGFVYALIEPSGVLKTWGSASYMPLGDGAPKKADRKVDRPQPVPGVTHAMDIALGTTHALVLLRDGTVLGWGENRSCEVGNGHPAHVPRQGDSLPTVLTPVPIPGLRDVVQVAAGQEVSVALTADGSVWTWGANAHFLLGRGKLGGGWGDGVPTQVPQRVTGLPRVRQVSLFLQHVLALLEDGTVRAWGNNRAGQLGDGTQTTPEGVVAVQGLTDIVQVSAGDAASAAVRRDGTVWTWGSNTNGMLGAASQSRHGGDNRRVPEPVAGVGGVVQVQASTGFMMVHLKDGTLRGWGEGYHGCLGNGSTAGLFPRPQTPMGLGAVKRFSLGHRRGFALRADGTVLAWGPLNTEAAAGPVGTAKVPLVLFPAR